MQDRVSEKYRAPSLTHSRASNLCQLVLKELGLGLTRTVDQHDGYDFLVEGRVRVAVRYAFPSASREQSYTKKNGELSRYSYKRWTFNFHRHGKISDRYCDFFVCLLGSDRSAGRGTFEVTCFVIPWEAITGLTFCSSIRSDSPRSYNGHYARYIDAWPLIAEAAGAGSSGLPRFKVSIDARRRFRLTRLPESGPEARSAAAGRF